MTTKNRPDLLRSSLQSLRETTQRDLYRLTVVQDGDFLNTSRVLDEFTDIIDYVVTNRKNEGLGPSINRALVHIDSTNRWFEDPLAGAPDSVAPFICYCQDDLLYTNGWLNRLVRMFMLFESQHRLGFVSGVECVEHAVRQDLGNGMFLKDWIRAAQMFARRQYWMSMWPIPRFDPETQRVRAKPNDGMGSGVDWHFIRNHPNSICRTNRTCLVIPGLVVHAGYARSTWLDRELPESEADKTKIMELTR